MNGDDTGKKPRIMRAKVLVRRAFTTEEAAAADTPAPPEEPPGDSGRGVTEYLEAILNLQCETQSEITELAKKAGELQSQYERITELAAVAGRFLPKAQEMYARVNGLQLEVEDGMECLSKLLKQDGGEKSSAPAQNHLMRDIGVAALLSPLIWNGISAGVGVLRRWTREPDMAGTFLLTSLISVAWGLLLMLLEPPLNRALRKWEKKRLADAMIEDEELENFLRR